MRPDRTRFILLFSLAAGLMDAGTGVLLLAAPRTTLQLFGASMPEGGDILMRYIGAFVLGVGLAYLWGLAAHARATRLLRLQGVWGATAVVRASVALFTATAALTGNLGYAWLVVSASDGLLAALQFRGLSARWFER